MDSKKNKQDRTLSEVIDYINTFSEIKITEEDVLGVIQKIAGIHRKKTFAYFTEEDIESQVVLICLEQIKYYEPLKGAGHTTLNSIERWLNRVTKNRLSNYYRDNYSSVNEKHKKTRASLNNCLDLDVINTMRDSSAHSFEEDPSYSLRLGEFKEFVEKNLSPEILEIYHACLDEENVSSYYKSKLTSEMAEVLDKWKKINGEENA